MGFGLVLGTLRRRRGLSQEQLALKAGLSQRHVSFLESGRSRPGPVAMRKLVAALALRGWEHRALFDALVPTKPEQSADPIDQLDLAMMIERFSPWPTYAFRSDGALLATNAALDALLARAAPGEDLWRATAASGGPNVYDLALAEAGLVRWMVNPDSVVPETLRRLHVEAAQDIGLLPTVARMQAYPAALRWPSHAYPPPILIERYQLDAELLSVISVLSQLSSPGELGLDRLRIETFVPADPASETLLRGLST